MKKSEPAKVSVHFSVMLKSASLAISLLLISLFAGCAPKALGPDPWTGPTDPMSKVVEDINRNNLPIKTLRAHHNFDAVFVDEKGKSRSFSGDGYLLFRKPTDLLLKAKGIIDFFEIGSNEDRYWFTAYPDEVSTQWWGYKKNFSDEKAAQIPIRPDLLLEVLGVLDISTDFLRPPVPIMRFNNDTRAYMFTWNRPLQNRWVAEKEVWFDVQSKLPKLILLFDENGRVILRAYLSEHKPIEGSTGQIATRFDLFFPENKSHMNFKLDDIHATVKRGAVTLPNDASFAFPEDPGVRKQQEIR